MRRSVAFVLALGLVTVTLAPTAVARDETASYTTGADVLAACSETLVGALLAGNYGSACFDVQDGESQVSVEIDDIYLDGVGGAISFQDAAGDAIGDPVGFCGSIDQVDMPDETARIEVFVNGPVFQAIECNAIGTATFGDIHVSFA